MLNAAAGELLEVDGRRCLKTKHGMSGIALFGPYATLEAGRYRIEFSIKPLASRDGKRDPLIAVADVTAGVVVVLFDALVFRSHLENDERYVAYFETDRTLTGIEYRLYVNGSEPLLIGDEPKVAAVERLEPRPTSTLPLVLEHADRVRRLFFSGSAIAVRARMLVVTLGEQSFVASTPQDLFALDDLAPVERPAPEAPQKRQTAALVVVVAMPSALGETGFALMGLVMNAVYGSHVRAHCATLAELRVHWAEHKGRPILLTTSLPDTALSDLLTTSNFPILAFFDDLADAVTYRVGIKGQVLSDAIRTCSHSVSCLARCVGSKQARIFDNRQYTMRLTEFVEAILDALGVAHDAAIAAQAVRLIAAAEGLGADATLEGLLRRRGGGETMATLAKRRFDAGEQAMISRFAANYGPFLIGQEAEIVEWPLELFYADGNGETGNRSVNLIGGARIIFFGPYMYLPVGGWRVVVQFEVAGNTAGNEIEADVWAVSAQTHLAKNLARLPVHGYFQFAIDFANPDPSAVLEIRLRLLKGAIEGRFGVRKVTLHPVANSVVVDDLASGQRPHALQDSSR